MAVRTDRARVLVVDDDQATVNLVRLYLEREQYEVAVAFDGRAAVNSIKSQSFDLIVLDWMLPGIDGLTLCEQIRAGSDVPIIMLTARVQESDKLLGLTSGADDYLTKPFSPRELAARVGVILRRVRGGRSNDGQLQAGPIRIDTPQHQAWVQDVEVMLTPTEFKLLSALAKEPRRVFSREQLIEQALDNDSDALPRTIDVHVNNLRRKLKQASRQELIGTVHGVGYRLEV
ncbi:MAG TPA: response regulator transcription factor [Chloroflexota bacterium]|nr:response regulator transcription factor [Chloroflexota bacterium]